MEVKSMIQEKILVEGEFYEKPNLAGGFWFFLAVIFGFSIIIVFILDLCKEIDFVPIEFYLGFGIWTFICLVVGAYQHSKASTDYGYEFYVTSYRIVGKFPLGELISIPLEQISSVETQQGVLIIKTNTRNLSIPYMKNLMVVFAHISNLTASSKKQIWRI